MNFLKEFFYGEEGRSSMSRLLMFGSFFVASYIMIALINLNEMNEGYFYGYLGVFNGTYLGGKVIDMKNKGTPA